jgi:hypothetical protein
MGGQGDWRLQHLPQEVKVPLRSRGCDAGVLGTGAVLGTTCHVRCHVIVRRLCHSMTPCHVHRASLAEASQRHTHTLHVVSGREKLGNHSACWCLWM